MKNQTFTEEQIIAVVKKQAAGSKAADLCCRHGIFEATFYNWKATYGGMQVSEAERLEELEEENAKLSSFSPSRCWTWPRSASFSQKMYGPPRPCKGTRHRR